MNFFIMLKNTCCSICLAINKRTINIYKTDLQYAYETLVNFKIREDECWMCYICHMRLRQCHQLQQLAVQTRGLIDDIFQKKIDIKFGAYGCLLELSTSRTKTFSTTLPHLKLESDGETEFYHNNSVPLDENLENTKGTRIISTIPNSSYIEQESDVKMEFCSADDLKQDEIVSNDYEVEEKISIDSEGPLDSSGQLGLSNVGNDAQKKSKVLKLKTVKLSVDKYVRQSPITYPDTEICHEDREHSSPRSSWEEQSTENAEIKLEIEEEMEDKGTIQDAEQKNTSDCEGENLKKGQLLMPIRSHDAKKPFCCDICSWKFSRKSHLIEHKVIHTGEKPFSCDICSKKFTQKGNLNVHKKNHMGNKPFSCDICSKKFTQKSTLTVHKKNHMGKQKNKPFSCDICSKKFTQKSNLNVHKQIHNSDKAYSCDICSKKFSQKVNLKYHKVIHTGNKSFSCNICSKKFAQTIRLKYHLRIHTGERSFSCDICSKKFLMKSHLNTHIRTHTGEKPFSCDICSMKFSRKCHLQQHKLIHTGEKPFSCDICSKNFLRKSHLNSHKRIHWPEKEYIYL